MAFALGTALIVGGSQLVGGYMQAKSAENAADRYSASGERALQYNREMYDKTNLQNADYRLVGENAAGLYNKYLNNGYFTNQPTLDDLTRLMPNYQFGLSQGMGALNSQLNAAGGLIGGNAIQGANQFAQNYAGTSLADAFNQYQVNRSNVVSNLGAGTNIGLNANTITANAGTGSATNASNVLSSIGNAQAASTMAAGQAFGNAANTISNYAMLYGLKNQRPTGTTGTTG
jgi:hypothetical protein